LTFLLEREREVPGPDGNFSSLWQKRLNALTNQISWFHLVTQREADAEPKESKGAILADDVRLPFKPFFLTRTRQSFTFSV
jgi:hypothetical protein